MSNDLATDDRQRLSSPRKEACDAELLLLWEKIKARGNEIDGLLDLALRRLSSAAHFPEKTDLERVLQKARTLL